MAVKMAPSGHFETMQFPFNFVTNEALDELLPLCEKHDVGFIAMKPFAGGMLGNATLAMKWQLQFDFAIPDPGIEKVEEIEEIVKIVEGSWELSSQEQEEIERIRAEVGTRFCRRCQYCLPCPQNINIPMMMNLPSFGKRFSAELVYSDRFVQLVETAKTCIKCGECEERCPYKLPIRDMLVENVSFYEKQIAD
jgi:predicted aldo/keto reductase-like oxidoreductase